MTGPGFAVSEVRGRHRARLSPGLLAMRWLGGVLGVASMANSLSIRTTIVDRVGYAAVLAAGGALLVWGWRRRRPDLWAVSIPLLAWSAYLVLQALRMIPMRGERLVSAVTDLLIVLTPLLFAVVLAQWRPTPSEVSRGIMIFAGLSFLATMIAWVDAGSARFEAPSALLVVVVLVLALAPPPFVEMTKNQRWVFAGIAGLLGLAIFASRSRTPLVIFLVVAGLLLALPAVDRRRRLRWAAIGVAGAIAVVLLGTLVRSGPSGVADLGDDLLRTLRLQEAVGSGKDTSVAARVDEASDAIRTMSLEGALLDPVIGFGHGATYQPHESRIKANIDTDTGRVHNIHITPVLVWFRYGWIGLALFVALFVVAFRSAWRTPRRDRTGLGLIVVLGLCAYAVDLTLRNALADPAFSLVLALALAGPAALSSAGAARTAAGGEPR